MRKDVAMMEKSDMIIANRTPPDLQLRSGFLGIFVSGGKPPKPNRRHISTFLAECAAALGRNTSGPAR
jgi:hypothetical protein